MHGINNGWMNLLMAIVLSAVLASTTNLASAQGASLYPACSTGTSMEWHLQNMGRLNRIDKNPTPPPPDHTDIISNPDGTYSVAGTPLLKVAVVANTTWSRTDPQGKVEQWVDEMTAYYANSGAAINFEVVCMDIDPNMPNWVDAGFEHLRPVYQSIAKHNQADLVIGLIGGQWGDPYCGIATLGQPNHKAPLHSVSRCNSKTLAHEVGHNLGLHHAHQSGYVARKGYCIAPYASARECWRGTIMSYAGNDRVPFFANKDHTYLGDPLGNDEHDAVEYLNKHKVGKALAWELTYDEVVAQPLLRGDSTLVIYD